MNPQQTEVSPEFEGVCEIPRKFRSPMTWRNLHALRFCAVAEVP